MVSSIETIRVAARCPVKVSDSVGGDCSTFAEWFVGVVEENCQSLDGLNLAGLVMFDQYYCLSLVLKKKSNKN